MPWGISNYSTTPASNTAINGINIAPGCPSSSVGPALRQMMADEAAALAGGQYVPTGSVFHFLTASAPGGYLACDGSAVSRTTYAALFALIGSTYGAGDGSTTFNLPDLRGRVIAGYDAANASGRLNNAAQGGVDASAVGHTGGEADHALVPAELAAHSHTITDPTHTHSATAGGNAEVWAVAGSQAIEGSGTGTFIAGTLSIGAAATGITGTNNAGSGTAHNTVQPTIILLPCVKT